MAKTKKRKKSFIKRCRKHIIVLVLLILICSIFNIASSNYIRDDIKDKVNLVISGKNVTKDLVDDIYIQDNIVYVSVKNILKFFDSTIIYDATSNTIITTSNKSVASIKVGENTIKVNSSNVEIDAGVIQKDNTYYIPLSELSNVYNISVLYMQKTNTVTVDYLNKSYVTATANKNINVKYKPSNLSRTLEKIKKGDTLVILNEETPKGWKRVRTQNGYLGYVKTNSIGKENNIREDIMDSNAKIEQLLNWEEFSSDYNIKTKVAKLDEEKSIISPEFFSLTDKGKVSSSIGTKSEKYIKWAQENSYMVLGNLSNKNVTSKTLDILNNYTSREKIINQIIDYIVTYNLDGVNINFESISKEEDSFSRFIIELTPRLNEIGKMLYIN